jgi:hypothetical protein
MIKKTTTATFKDGDYAGQYDWQGGIPLSVGEKVQVTLNGVKLNYKLVDKTTDLIVQREEQLVNTSYLFELSN